MINEGPSEIIGPFPVPSPKDKRERNDDPGQKRRGHRYTVHPSNRTISIDYRDRRSVNYLDHSHRMPSTRIGVRSALTSTNSSLAGRLAEELKSDRDHGQPLVYELQATESLGVIAELLAEFHCDLSRYS